MSEQVKKVLRDTLLNYVTGDINDAISIVHKELQDAHLVVDEEEMCRLRVLFDEGKLDILRIIEMVGLMEMTLKLRKSRVIELEQKVLEQEKHYKIVNTNLANSFRETDKLKAKLSEPGQIIQRLREYRVRALKCEVFYLLPKGLQAIIIDAAKE